MKMWDGRFSKPVHALMDAFNRSLPFDQILIDEDIAGSIAWARALHRAGVLSEHERERIIAGLESIRARYARGEIQFSPADEDIHMAVERLLTEEIGEPAKKLHTGRSRNDQVATDFRLYCMRSLAALVDACAGVQRALLARAESEQEIVVPGYTHLQQAQPVSLAHYWLSFFFCLEREKERLRNAAHAADYMPLGSGALAGCGFQVDRKEIAAELGFSRLSDNSMDGVASRDFVLEALAAISSLGIHCSRYAEDLIVWSSREFGFIELDDAWSTGSSMMPQKKNPDSLELIRGKAGRFIGNYTRFAATLKGLGLTYFKDLQEDKEPAIDSFAQINLVLRVFAEVLGSLSVKPAVIQSRMDPFLLATDLADYLVRKDVPFREAHKVIGKLVAWCAEAAREFNTLTVAELRKFHDAFGDDVVSLFDWRAALNGRDIEGGSGPQSVARQLQRARRALDAAPSTQ
jgi:argininosuccinate lyase